MEESKYYFERFQLTPKLYVNKEVILKIKKRRTFISFIQDLL